MRVSTSTSPEAGRRSPGDDPSGRIAWRTGRGRLSNPPGHNHPGSGAPPPTAGNRYEVRFLDGTIGLLFEDEFGHRRTPADES